jgi:hypothetical protein
MGAASDGWQALVLAMAAGATSPDRAPMPTAASATIVFFITRCIGSEAQRLKRAHAGSAVHCRASLLLASHTHDSPRSADAG